MTDSTSALFLTDPQAAIRLRQMQMAQALMQQGGKTDNIRSPWQVAGNMAQTLVGALQSRRIEQEALAEAQRNRQEANAFNTMLAEQLSRMSGGQPTMDAPAQPPAMSAPAPAGPSAPSMPAASGTRTTAPAAAPVTDGSPAVDASMQRLNSVPGRNLPVGVTYPGQGAAFDDQGRPLNPLQPGRPWAAGLPPANGQMPDLNARIAALQNGGQPAPAAPAAPVMPVQALAGGVPGAGGNPATSLAATLLAARNSANPMIARNAASAMPMITMLHGDMRHAADVARQDAYRREDRDYQRGRDATMDTRYAADQQRQEAWRREDQNYRATRDSTTDAYRNLPQGMRPGPGGAAEPIPGIQPPQAPGTVISAMLENVNALRRIQQTQDMLRERNGAGVGIVAGVTPGFIMNRMDSGNVDLRAMIADIGSMKIHDRSGAAVSASEFPRLQPFIPSVGDSPETIQAKLQNFAREYEATLRDQYSVYGPQGGGRRIDLVEQALAPRQPAAGQGGAQGGAVQPGTVVDGYRFRGGNPNDRNSWEPVR